MSMTQPAPTGPPTVADPPAAQAGAKSPSAAALPDWTIGLLLGLFALLVRAVYLIEIRSIPFVHHLVADAEAYRNWARRIALGDWLGGSEIFYQAPLYPYFLAVVMRTVGEGPLMVRLVQAMVGSAAVVLLFHAGRVAFSRGVGITAALVLALYPPAIFFDGLIQKAVLDGVGVCALLLLAIRCTAQPSLGRFAALGACTGLLILSRENALLFVPVIVGWCLWTLTDIPWRIRALRSAACLAGVAAVLLPVGIRNAWVGGQFVLTTSQAGPNFYIGNNPAANGSYVPLLPGRGNTPFERVDAIRLAEQSEGRTLTPTEVSSYWFRKAGAYIRENPAHWARLLALKALYSVHAYEIPDSEDQYYYAQSSFVLRLLSPLLHMGVILPLGVLGAVLLLRRRDVPLIAALALTVIAGVVIFYVFGRYRYPLAPMCILLAAAGVFELIRRLRSGRALSAIPALAAGIAVAVVANGPTSFSRTLELAVSHSNAGLTLARAGDLPRAMRELRRALELSPDLRSAHYGLGKVLLMEGRLGEAMGELNLAYEAGPPIAYITSALGSAHLVAGNIERAAELLESAASADPLDAETWINLADARGRLGLRAEAQQALRNARKADPREAHAAHRLAWSLATSDDGSLRNAEEALRHASDGVRLTGGRDPAALDALAAAQAEAGRFDEAARNATAAAELARRAGRHDLAARIEARARGYQESRPHRE
ncbi:MAG: glycosyltransferase family 39 protein [Phycisphaerales bacterium]|nr:glycosyltransferase family 39 protein [Phycisphaerales bacterium]